MLDRLVIRTLGGIRPVDHVTGLPPVRATQGFLIESPELRFALTRGGIWHIRSAPGFEAYTRAFDPVPAPAAAEFTFTISDPAGQFLPVAGRINLPRDAAPGAVANRVDTPLDVALPSAPGRRVATGWTPLRVSVTDQAGAGLRGALIVATDTAAGAEIGWGLTDPRGEALLPLAGIPLLRVVAPDPGDPPPDPEDPPELTTAVTPVALAVTYDPARPWPVEPALLRAGDPGFVTAVTAADVPVIAGTAAHLRLSLTLGP